MLRRPTEADQVALVWLRRVAQEPLGYTVIFPFISFFLEDLKVTDKPEKIGEFPMCQATAVARHSSNLHHLRVASGGM